MNRISKIVLMMMLGTFAMVSCEKERCNETVPELSYKEFFQEIDPNAPQDSITYRLVLEFSDCDGDLGFDAGDSVKDSYGEFQTKNFFIDLYYRDNNNWVMHDLQDGEGFNSTMPYLGNNSNDPLLTGELERKFLLFYGYDTIQFRTRILDNAGNYSNLVETPPFAIP